MSILTGALIPQLEKRVPKVISPTIHGLIDYGHAAFFLGLGLVLRKTNKRAAAAAFTTSAFILTQSLLTDYPLGAKPVLPFTTHGKIDAAFASSSWIIPRLFGFSGTPAARVYQVNAMVEAAVVSLTDWNDSRARTESAQMHEAVASAVAASSSQQSIDRLIGG